LSSVIGERLFPDSQDHFDRLEGSIAAELWRWASLADDERAEIIANQSKLAVDLEFWLCGAFHQIDFTRSRRIWCDGVIEIAVSQFDDLSFRVVAAAYSPNVLAPVELEFYFAESTSTRPSKTILQFGFADWDRAAQGRQNWRRDVRAMLENRPKTYQQWAVAVELTSIGSPAGCGYPRRHKY
jgi:hypothetical protein